MKKVLSLVLLLSLVPSLVFGQPNFSDFKELEDYYTNKDIFVSYEVEDLDFEATKEVLSGVDDVLVYYPQLKGTLASICVRDLDDGILAVNQYGTLWFSDYFLSSYTLAKESYNWKIGIHPKNSKFKSGGYHEMGHIIELYIVQHENTDKIDEDWIECKTAKNIVNIAMSRVEKLTKYENVSYHEMVYEIFSYALANDSETIAEAVSDYFTNGDNSSTLSLYIIEELEKRMEIIQNNIDNVS